MQINDFTVKAIEKEIKKNCKPISISEPISKTSNGFKIEFEYKGLVLYGNGIYTNQYEWSIQDVNQVIYGKIQDLNRMSQMELGKETQAWIRSAVRSKYDTKFEAMGTLKMLDCMDELSAVINDISNEDAKMGFIQSYKMCIQSTKISNIVDNYSKESKHSKIDKRMEVRF